MRYGAMNFPIRPVVDEFEAIADLGFDYLELTLDAPQAHHRKVRRQMDDLTARLAARGLGLVCHLPTFVYVTDLTDRIREASVAEMVDSLTLAADLGAEKIVLHPGGIGGLAVFVEERARGYALACLERLVRQADRLGVRLCLENMFPRYRAFCRPRDFKSVFDRFPELMLTLDTGHAHIDSPAGRRLLEFVRLWPDRLGHLHVSDNHGRADEHLTVGRGTIDFSAFTAAVAQTGYHGTVTLEVFSDDRRELVRSRDRIEALFRRVQKNEPDG